MAEQGQPPPDPRAEQSQDGSPPPDQGTTPPAERGTGATTDTQASSDSDERRPADTPGATAPPAPPPVSWGTLSPEDRRRLLDEADPEELRKHERVAGLSGQMAERLYRRRVEGLRYEDLPEGVRDDLARKVREDLDRQRQIEQERQLGSQGEYYALGEQRWRALQEGQTDEQRRAQERAVESRTLQTFFKDVQSWALDNYPGEVLDRAAAKLNSDDRMGGMDAKGQYQLWLKVLNETHAEHLAAQREAQTRQKWEKEELPAHRERWLAERNGKEPSPETDGGPPPGVRELTDEMIAAMDLDEFKAVWDMKRDRPKEGYRYRPTRAVDPRKVQAAGNAV